MDLVQTTLIFLSVVVACAMIFFNQEHQIQLQKKANELLERNNELLSELIDTQFKEDDIEESEVDESSPFYQIDRDEDGNAEPGDWWKHEKKI